MGLPLQQRLLVDAARDRRFFCVRTHLQRIEVAPVPLESLECPEVFRILIAPTKPFVDVFFGTGWIVHFQQPFAGLLEPVESGFLAGLFIGTHDCTLSQASVAEWPSRRSRM